jgi:hypothetical protein
VHLVRFKVADVRQQQAYMDLHRRQAAPLVPLGQVARGAVAKQRACMRSTCEFHLDVRDFALQAHLDLVNGRLAEAQADAGAAVALVDEVVAISVDRDAGGTGRGHNGPPFVRKEEH